MIVLHKEDIDAHIVVAEQLDSATLNCIISSLRAEYDDLKGKISEPERNCYQVLLEIYSDELMSRYVSNLAVGTKYLQ